MSGSRLILKCRATNDSSCLKNRFLTPPSRFPQQKTAKINQLWQKISFAFTSSKMCILKMKTLNRYEGTTFLQFLRYCSSRPLFCLFSSFPQFKCKLMKAQMVCMGLVPRAAGWKAQTNPLSYGDTQFADLQSIVKRPGHVVLQ